MLLFCIFLLPLAVSETVPTLLFESSEPVVSQPEQPEAAEEGKSRKKRRTKKVPKDVEKKLRGFLRDYTFPEDTTFHYTAGGNFFYFIFSLIFLVECFVALMNNRSRVFVEITESHPKMARAIFEALDLTLPASLKPKKKRKGSRGRPKKSEAMTPSKTKKAESPSPSKGKKAEKGLDKKASAALKAKKALKGLDKKAAKKKEVPEPSDDEEEGSSSGEDDDEEEGDSDHSVVLFFTV